MRRVSATWVVLLQWLVATTTPAGCGAAPEVPNVAVQYGPFRSASTLQYQMLCAIMFLVHGDDGDVECSFLSRVNVEGTPISEPGAKAKGSKADWRMPPPPKVGAGEYVVLKTHAPLTVPNDAGEKVWVFATSNGTDLASGGLRALGYPVKLVQSTVDLALHGHHEFASRLADIFGLGDDRRDALLAYVRYWDVLRQCCGAQMSEDWYRVLMKEKYARWKPNYRPHHAIDAPSYPACETYNVTAVEAALVATRVFAAYGPRSRALRSLSVADGDLDGTYCARTTAFMARARTPQPSRKRLVGFLTHKDAPETNNYQRGPAPGAKKRPRTTQGRRPPGG